MKVTENLLKLSDACREKEGKLYVVGGAVRNHILGFDEADIDICGNLLPEQIMEVATTCGFRSQIVNPKLGTVLITADKEQYEYTTFRSENYTTGHSPSEVQFIDDIKLDAKRRDFTINAMYYDIYTGNVLDFYNGRLDLRNQVIRTVETPDYVFASDGLRLLRLIRFASELGFKIDKQTLKVAQNNIYMLKDISAERKLKELKLILLSDFRYGKANNCIKLFNKLNIYPNLFGLDLKIKNNAVAKRVFATSADARYYAFCALLLLTKYNFKYIPENQVEFDIHKIFGKTGLKDSNANLQELMKMYFVLQQFMFGKKISVMDLIRYNALNPKSKRCIGVFLKNQDIERNIDELRADGIPMNLDEVDITNLQLKQFVEDEHISKIKFMLFEMCIRGQISNTYHVLLDKALEIDAYLKELKSN